MGNSGADNDIEMAVMNSEDQPLLQPQFQTAQNRVPIFERLNGVRKLNLLMVMLIAVMLLVYVYHLCMFLKKAFRM